MRIEKNIRHLTRRVSEDPQVPWVLLILITAAFLVIVYPGLMITDNDYAPGDVAERDVKAPQDFLVEDTNATEANRQEAENSVLTVYDHDPYLAGALSTAVQRAFESMQQTIAAFRREPPGLSETAPQGTTAAGTEADPALRPEVDAEETLHQALWDSKPEFETRLGIELDEGVFKALVAARFDPAISELVVRTLGEVMGRGIVTDKDIPLRLSERGIALRTLGTGAERTVRDFNRFFSLDQARTATREIALPLVEHMDYTWQNLVIDLAQRLLQPNITLNRHETEERRRAAVEEVKPVFHKIKAGEMLLREGERIADIQLLKLNALKNELKNRQVVETSIGAALLIVCLLIATYMLHLQLKPTGHMSTNRDLLFVASVIVFFLVIGEVAASLGQTLTVRADIPLTVMTVGYVTPMAAAAMLICLFLGLQTALHASLILSVGLAIIFNGSFDMVVFAMMSCAMGAYWVQDCRERKVFAKAGLKTGLLNAAVITAIAVYHADMEFPRLGWEWVFGIIGGFFSSILAAGIAPLAEITFGYTSDIKLLELANLDQPIMRKLMIEAPGTYHHSVIVGSMVEAAASEIGANPLLAKVCGYYHDIGKIKKPAYFIENQSGRNRHDKLAPSMSALILIAHIKDGVEMARQHKLGRVIMDTICEHHGTSLIRYFYEKAKTLKGEENVKMSDYRYPGPKPQTREAGLVMLADVVEAASRTLENPTPSRIQGMVQTLVNMIFSDGQLDNCELTLKDIHKIAKVFNRILTGIHHHRVEYPERKSAANVKGRQRDGNPDRQPPKPGSDRPAETSENGAAHLKRLGLS